MLEVLIKYIFLFLSAAMPAVLASLRLVIDYICAIIAIAYQNYRRRDAQTNCDRNSH
ncbi:MULTISPECIES: hypothetical protein [unclassified Nostoc]|uniref:hypothetical protein n=1 Tax=unclassified Nostoc TaxID=2593658 RepID=UPI0013D8CC59|nr:MULTISPECIES: hypothetical protein [unclassified Nostoc]MBE8998246.1 hypothetical protein [Nostoc sp. LEGE 12447]NEU83451.1 hypothetical protein [Nostoc sp. UIC 10630]